jgi:hypothetical protein
MRIPIYVFFIAITWPLNIFAADSGKSQENVLWSIVLIVLSGIIGYFVGAIKSFREEKQKAYGEIIPPILKMAYNPQDMKDEQDYSKALGKLWLYGSKGVAQKMEAALKIMHDPSKGNVTKALQEAVVEMRKDIQLWPWQKLKPEDVNHLYTRIIGGKE